MHISAVIVNENGQHSAVVQTNNTTQTMTIPPKPVGYGSAINGGELLCAALATCFCNDLYREASKTGMKLHKVTVEAWAEFRAEGEPGRGIHYRAQVEADASAEEIASLIRTTDKLAEIHNTLRNGARVTLVE